MTVNLSKGGVVVNLNYIGDGVVLESYHDINDSGASKLTPHYLADKAQALDYIIRGSYALLNMGFVAG